MPSGNHGLQTYREKRNLARSGEPAGRRRRPTKRPRSVIPEGQYGAGAVLAWDTGHYENRGEADGELARTGRTVEDLEADAAKPRRGQRRRRVP